MTKVSNSILPSWGFFHPRQLFANGEQGYIYDASADEVCFQNSNGTTAAAQGDPVGYLRDLSPNGNHCIQATSGRRPTRGKTGPAWYIAGDGVDDALAVNFTFPQPFTRITCMELTGWASTQHVIGGGSSNHCNLWMFPTSPRLSDWAGTWNGHTFDRFPTGGYPALLTEVLNGASSGIACLYDPLVPENLGTTGPDGVTLFSSSGNTGTNSAPARFYSVVAIGRVLTEAERRKVLTWSHRHWKNKIVGDGDSILYAPSTGYAHVGAAAIATPHFMLNAAIGGSRLSQNGPSGTPPYPIDGTNYAGDLVYRADFVDRMLFQRRPGETWKSYSAVGTNDAPTSGGQAAWIATYTSYLLGRRAAGFDKIYVATILPRSDGLKNSNRGPLNTAIRAMCTANGFVCVDLAADATMGPDAASDNTTLYPDTVHPAASAHSTYLAPIFTAALALV